MDNDGIFAGVPALAKLVIGQTADTISLDTHVDIECRPAFVGLVDLGPGCVRTRAIGAPIACAAIPARIGGLHGKISRIEPREHRMTC